MYSAESSSTSPNYTNQQKHHYNYGTSPQHFHHPNALNQTFATTPLHNNRDDNDTVAFPPPPPPLSTTISNIQTSTQTFRSNPKLTGNSVPRPYPGSPVSGSPSFGVTGRLSQPSSSSPLTTTNCYKPSNVEQTNLKHSTSSNLHEINRNLEASIQNLHEKTYGKDDGSTQIINSNSSSGQQNYDGYTTR